MIKTLVVNLYFKSRLVFSLLKLNDTELLILVTELFFLSGKGSEVQSGKGFFANPRESLSL